MQRTDVQVATPDGMCPSIVITPDGDGPWSPVIVYMDAGGVRPAIVAIAEQVAALGHLAFVPEMYYRHGEYEPFDMSTAFSDPDERQRVMSMAGSLTKEMAVSDTTAFLEFFTELPAADATRVGTTGYCMGGSLSLLAASHHPDRIVAAASFHGGNLASDAPDSPHLTAARITGRVYVASAQDDGSFPPEQAALLEETLTAGDVDYTIEQYAGHHGFAVIDNPTYDEAADARHRAALQDLFDAML